MVSVCMHIVTNSINYSMKEMTNSKPIAMYDFFENLLQNSLRAFNL